MVHPSSWETQARVFSGGWSRKLPLPGMAPKLWTSKRKARAQHKRKAHCTNSLVTLSLFHHLRSGGNLPEIQVQRCQPRATLRAGRSNDGSLSPAMLTLFCTVYILHLCTCNIRILKFIHLIHVALVPLLDFCGILCVNIEDAPSFSWWQIILQRHSSDAFLEGPPGVCIASTLPGRRKRSPNCTHLTVPPEV